VFLAERRISSIFTVQEWVLAVGGYTRQPAEQVGGKKGEQKEQCNVLLVNSVLFKNGIEAIDCFCMRR
jgi:hypothetical protein